MASLKQIELLAQRLNAPEPAWIRGYSKRDNHLSGALRELAERCDDPDISLDYIEMEIKGLLEEAAETLDDAHQEWLNLQLAGRDICGDVEAMRTSAPDDNSLHRHWFGGFTESMTDWDGGGDKIAWPNLSITARQLADVLSGKEYKL